MLWFPLFINTLYTFRKRFFVPPYVCNEWFVFVYYLPVLSWASTMDSHTLELSFSIDQCHDDYYYNERSALSSNKIAKLYYDSCYYDIASHYWLPSCIYILYISCHDIEQHDANNLPTEQKKIYDEVFKSHGMKLIDFLHLMSISKRHEIKRKEKLVELGKIPLYFRIPFVLLFNHYHSLRNRCKK